jgi:hypothetical protein
MYNEDKKWFSQTLLYYEDHLYQTDGKLRIGISTNSSDDKNFNPPAFNISLSHNYQKSCNLNIQQATDLTTAILKAKEVQFNNIEILRRISKNLELSIQFKTDQNELPVVEIILRSSNTDFTKIIIPIDVFMIFAKRLAYFVNNFDELCYQLLMKNIDGEYREIIRQLPGLIRGISSQIISGQIPEARAADPEAVEEAPAAATIAELDNFLGPNLSNVVVPELESGKVEVAKETFSEVKSEFVEKILEGKLETLENILVNIQGDVNPVMMLNDYFISGIGKDITYLPDLEGDELKSSLYISKLLCSLITSAHIKFESPIPTSTPILKYKVKTVKDENLDLSYDLLLIFAYIRNLRNRMSDKSNDFISNKSNFYLQLRCFLDVFCFSFLEKSDKNQLRSIISNRYKYYDSIGFFDHYKDLLKKHNCTDITIIDIDTFINEACEKVIGKSMYITEQHDSLVESNSFRIPSRNNFTLEQIVNEVIPLEVDEKMGVDITNTKNTSPEVLNWFVGQKTPTVKKETKEKSSNIIRFATHYRNEIPEQHREKFIEWLKSEEDKNFSFSDCPFPLVEFGGNIIKGLYLWKPVDTPKILINYKYFYTQFEECILDKSHILALDEKVEEKKTDEWSNAFDNISFE